MLFARFTDTTGFAVVNAPSATPLPPICYATLSNPAGAVLRYDARAVAGDTTVVANPGWKYARRIRLNTSATGAGVSQDIAGFPVLIRLTKDNFDFTPANTDGSDIRFSRSDTIRLPYEIERWDAGGGFAEVWVKVDTMYGNDSEQTITMYWGNAAATAPPVSGTVFDTADGFQGVWHMGDASEDTVRDATLNRYHGVSPDSALPSGAGGIVGNCREFDGRTDFITMPNTATGRLDLQQDGKYSVSAWVKADTFVDLQQTLVSKGKYQYFLWVDSTSWQFWEYQDGAGWEAATQRATLKQWVLLTGVRDGNAQYLYVNGESADSLSLKFDIYPRNTESDLILGRAHDAADSSFFRGDIDEVRIENTVRKPDWVRLSYMNQRTDDRLVINKK
jgi:biopolymer transport protein ExbB